MKFKKCIAAAVALLVSGITLAQSPNSILSAIGANGSTDEIPTGVSKPLYAGFLVKLDSTGTINASLLPSGEGDPVALNNVIFLDQENGSNGATYSGSIQRPWQTFEYAISQVSNDTVFVFMPGTYTNVNTTVSNCHYMVLMGLDPENTILEGEIQFQATNDVVVKVSGMQVTTIRQQKYQDIDVHLYNQAQILNQINRQYPTSTNSVLTLYRDPSATLANPITTTNSVEVLTHDAVDMNYDPSDTNKWWGIDPVNIAGALDQLADRVAQGTNTGQMVYWNGTNWQYIASGTTNQYLRGGDLPYWEDVILWPGTNVGQMVYWDGTNWTYVAAGSSNQVLFGSSVGDSVPSFKVWGDVYDAYDVPYDGDATEAARIGVTDPTEVGTALDNIYSNMVPRGTSIGDLTYWNGTNWVVLAAGTTNQFLRGGTAPALVDHVLVPEGTVADQLLQWDGTNWLAVALQVIPAGTETGQLLRWNGTNWVTIAKGGAYDVLWGGSVPNFNSPSWIGLGTNAVLGTGSEDGQIMYWNTTSNFWVQLPAGQTNEMLVGGPEPYWTNAVPFFPVYDVSVLNNAYMADKGLWITNGTGFVRAKEFVIQAAGGSPVGVDAWVMYVSDPGGLLGTYDVDSGGWVEWPVPSVSGDLVAYQSWVDSNEWVSAPASASATGTAGQKAYDSDYFYICVATDTWKRLPLSSW